MSIFEVVTDIFISFADMPLLVPLMAVLVGFSVVGLIKKAVFK